MFHLGGRTGRPDPRWDGGSEKTGSQTDVRRTRTALSELEPQTETGKHSCQHRKVDVRTKNIWIKTDVTYHSSEITNSLLQQQKCVVKWWKWVYSFLSIHKLVEYVDVDMKLETWLQFFASIPPELWCSAGFWPVLNTFLAVFRHIQVNYIAFFHFHLDYDYMSHFHNITFLFPFWQQR